MHARCHLGLIVCLSVLSVASVAHAADDLILAVDLQTDLDPGVDWVGAVATLTPRAGGRAHVRRTVALLGDDFVAGERIADFTELTDGPYDLEVLLVDAGGQVVGERSVGLLLDGSFGVTLVFSRPRLAALKAWSLATDTNGDGAINAGDVIRYTVDVSVLDAGPDGASGVMTFDDTPGVGTRLVAGSVTTTQGVVEEGHRFGDTRVVVRLGEMFEGAVERVTFDAVLTPAVQNQGRITFDGRTVAQGPRNGLVISQLTDDAATVAVQDPTVTPLSSRAYEQCVAGREVCEAQVEGCNADLEQCQDSLQSCEGGGGCAQALAEANARVAAAYGDPDQDQVPALADDCPDTEAGAPVDDNGCSRWQFCTRITGSRSADRRICRRADWRGDEPLANNPRDCAPTPNGCFPR